VPDAGASTTSFREPVEGLVDLARSAREPDLSRVLEAVADAVAELCRFRSLVINVYRPAWDDYEAVLVRGRPEMERALQGTRITSEEFSQLLNTEPARLPGTFFLTEESEAWQDLPHTYTPPGLPISDHPEAWLAEDGLIVVLSDTSGAPLGFLSVDEPENGLRPTDDELRLLRGICSHAEQALESARHHRESAEGARMNAEMVLASGRIAASTELPELSAVLADTITEHLGFERVAIYALDRSRTFKLLITRGWEAHDRPAPELSESRVKAALIAEHEQAGGWLVAAADLFGDATPGRSRRNGRGPLGWSDHCLVVPALDSDGDTVALVMVEDPQDHQLPSDQRRNLVRLVTDQASGAWASLRLRQIHGRLLGLVLVREGAPALAEALAETIGAPVALLDWSGRPIARATWGGRHVAIPPRHELDMPGPPSPDGVSDRAAPIIRPLELGHVVEGYLVVEGSERPEPARELAVEQAAVSFGLQLVMLSNAEGVEARMRGNLIDELLDSTVVDLDGLRRRARRLGQDLDELRVAIAIEPFPGETEVKHAGFIHLARTVRAVLDAAGLGSIIVPRAGSVLALVTDSGPLGYRQLGERILQEAQVRAGVPVAVGISRLVADPSGLAPAVREAQQALRAARSLPKLSALALAGELELHDMLLAAPRSPEITQAARRLLLPLSEPSGRARGGELVSTLATYLETVGHLESAARRLGIHINTMRHRIGRIEELLGRDLRDARTRLDLQLALELVEPGALEAGAPAGAGGRSAVTPVAPLQ
jgi:sugar diacid utilization regulator/GAF domain-containing protein